MNKTTTYTKHINKSFAIMICPKYDQTEGVSAQIFVSSGCFFCKPEVISESSNSDFVYSSLQKVPGVCNHRIGPDRR